MDRGNKGEPVPEADRERVFERFFRSQSARDGEDGMGLGLSLFVKSSPRTAGRSILASTRREGTRCG